MRIAPMQTICGKRYRNRYGNRIVIDLQTNFCFLACFRIRFVMVFLLDLRTKVEKKRPADPFGPVADKVFGALTFAPFSSVPIFPVERLKKVLYHFFNPIDEVRSHIFGHSLIDQTLLEVN